MVENKNANINLIYNCVMTGFSRGEGVPLHRGHHQLGAYTNPNKCIAYPRILSHVVYSGLDQTTSGFNLGRLFPARIIPGVNAAQAGLYPGILCPGTIYTPGYIMA